MPKFPTDKRRYYNEDMSEGGRGSAGRATSRGTRPPDSERISEHRSRSSAQHGAAGGYPPGAPRRPGQPPPLAIPGPSHAAPYVPSASASTSSAPPPEIPYSSSARGEHFKSERPQAYSDPSSETASVASASGSTRGGDSASLGRGSMRGRKILPVDIITRPRHVEIKQGGHGAPIQLEANYFKLLSTTNWCLYKYCVDFAPEEDRNVVRKGLLRHHRDTLGAYIFDGSVLYTSQRLTTENQTLQLVSERQSDNQQVYLTIRCVGDMTRGDSDYIQFFNIIMRKCLDYLQLQLVGRNYFDAHNKADVREFRLELWPGYITSIRQHERDILMCAEITHKVMRNETLLDVLNDCYRNDNQNYKRNFEQLVIGVVVLTDYNNNTYRVDDVDWDVKPTSTFKKKNGEEISYNDYYRSKYDINIRQLQQPLLVSRSKQKDRRAGQAELVYLVPELCRSTGLTDDMRSDFRLMKALAVHTRVSPADRIRKLMAFNRRLQNTSNVVTEFRNWNLTLDTQLVTVPGRVFPAEKITLDNRVVITVPQNANWTNELRNKSLVKCGSLEEWVVVVHNRFRRECQNFVSTLIRVASNMHFRIEQPIVYDLRDDNPASYAQMLEHIKSKENPMLIFCVASNNRADRYSAIKKKCCVDRPVPTQVVLSKNLGSKAVMSIATKVAIQMNCKIGGIPWTISVPLTGLMVVGFDVCHDTSSKKKDFGAMVASLDVNFGRYFSAVSSHTSGEELSSDLSVNLCKAIEQFAYYNSGLPKKIVIYRDGVGEGQIPYVKEHEVEQIKSKLAKVYDNPEDIKLAYILVTKKINTRFFCNGSNPGPGTIVDDVVTNPARYDFFIISQHVSQGTVTPTAYNIIEDTSDLSVDKIQRLTYKFCHMYFNWSGTVRVPAPCQYAHKLAFLVAQAVHQPPSTILETLLYFL